MRILQSLSLFSFMIAATALTSCDSGGRKAAAEKDGLPIFGEEQILKTDDDGNEYIDTVYRTVDNFAFINQDSQVITEENFDGKVRVVDFFFTSCPTICPDMKKQMLRIYKEFEDHNDVRLLSHSIDTKHDSVPVLRKYAEKMEVSAPKWHLITGDKNMIYNVAEKYMVSAEKDNTAPGGYLHSGAFVLIDQQHRIRGYYDGTDPGEVNELMEDMKKLLVEK